MQESFKERLSAARIKAALSQTELAALCEMAPTQISRYETGRSHPRGLVIHRIAAALGVSPQWLSNGGDHSKVMVAIDLSLVPTAELLAELGRRCER